jgi:heme/copper-type cytochrome/quinol oxidase subunit 2
METRVVRALAVIAATVSAVALLVMLFLTLFVVSLGFRANATPDSRKRTRDD